MKGISVVICCYNSASRIEKTLEHLILQRFTNQIQWEVILVDNNCADDTVSLARRYWEKSDLGDDHLVVIKENKPGLSEARYAGVKNAKYSYIVFCDDDNWLCEDYLEKSFDIIMNSPPIGALGGENIGISNIAFPEWWDSLKENFAVGKQGIMSGDISKRMFVWGAGMVTRRELYLSCFSNQFPSLLNGRKGNIPMSGDDSEYCARLLIKGYRLYYDDSLQLQHFISRDRLSIEYLNAMMKGHQESYEMLKKYYLVLNIMDLTFLEKIKKTFCFFRTQKNSNALLLCIFFILTGKFWNDKVSNFIVKFSRESAV